VSFGTPPVHRAQVFIIAPLATARKSGMRNRGTRILPISPTSR